MIAVGTAIGQSRRITVSASMMTDEFFTKAEENLQAADTLFGLGLYNAAANRAYYAAFQAAIALLSFYGIRHNENPHSWVQAQLAAELIHRRKVLPSSLTSSLREIQQIRNIADYNAASVSKIAVYNAASVSKIAVEAGKKGE